MQKNLSAFFTCMRYLPVYTIATIFDTLELRIGAEIGGRVTDVSSIS
jgi:hypothetical protein